MTGLRILVVEDDQHLSRVMSRLLRAHFEVVVVQTFASALAALDDSFDVVLSDWHLGDADGLVLLEQVRDRHPRTRRILMSATALDTHAELRVRACSAVFLRKPFERDVLQAAIERNTDYHPSLLPRNVS